MSKIEIEIKKTAAEIKEQANIFQRGADWNWNLVEGMLTELVEYALAHAIASINAIDTIADERPNRE